VTTTHACHAPAWFTDAIAREPELSALDVAGCRIHLRAWGAPDRPGLLLVHGGAAHGGWWDHIAPFFAGTHRVVALDLSGHGDSGHRAGYGIDTWSEEVVAAAGTLDRPVLVGHSLGGRVGAVVAARHPHALGGLVLVDAPTWDGIDETDAIARSRRPHRVYATVAEALDRWATLPRQETTAALPYVERRIAAQSLRPAEGGWTWKFDPRVLGLASSVGDVSRRTCPAVLLRAEHGILDAEKVRAARDHLVVVDLPAAGHHPMLDQPLQLVAAIRAVLALMSVTVP